jgi:transposase-like protein
MPLIPDKQLYCPTENYPTTHTWNGYYKHYSSWVCKTCGLATLGEPYKPHD